MGVPVFPGRCPGLSYHAPSGLNANANAGPRALPWASASRAFGVEGPLAVLTQGALARPWALISNPFGVLPFRPSLQPHELGSTGAACRHGLTSQEPRPLQSRSHLLLFLR